MRRKEGKAQSNVPTFKRRRETKTHDRRPAREFQEAADVLPAPEFGRQTHERAALAPVESSVELTRAVRGGNDERRAAEHHQRRRSLDCRHLEGLLLEAGAADEKGAAEDEEQVRQDRPEQRGLDDAELASSQGEDTCVAQ